MFKFKFVLTLDRELARQVERLLQVLEDRQADTTGLEALLPKAREKTEALQDAIDAAQAALK